LLTKLYTQLRTLRAGRRTRTLKFSGKPPELREPRIATSPHAKSTLVELGTMVKKMARYRLHAAMAMAA
jgi:hypothetical protein